MIVTLLFGVIGWWDDYKKLVLKNSLGLSARAKYFWLSVVCLGAALFLYYTAQTSHEIQLLLPFVKNIYVDVGIGFILISYLVIVGARNAVYLTDRLACHA